MKTRTLPADIKLDQGSHESFEEGHCAMEVVAWLANEPHSDHPQCACPVLGAFVRSWNDSLSDDKRNDLILPFVLQLVNTKSTPEAEEKRAWLATDWLVRTLTPAFLDLSPSLRDHAKVLSSLPPVQSRDSALSAKHSIVAARAAARAAAWAAAWDAARAAAGAAAWDAARDAARAAAWAAAWDAAGTAASAAARDAASAAARDAAGAAAGAAARAAAWDAASAAASAALRSTVEEMQASAADLLERMIAVQGEDRA